MLRRASLRPSSTRRRPFPQIGRILESPSRPRSRSADWHALPSNCEATTILPQPCPTSLDGPLGILAMAPMIFTLHEVVYVPAWKRTQKYVQLAFGELNEERVLMSSCLGVVLTCWRRRIKQSFTPGPGTQEASWIPSPQREPDRPGLFFTLVPRVYSQAGGVRVRGAEDEMGPIKNTPANLLRWPSRATEAAARPLQDSARDAEDPKAAALALRSGLQIAGSRGLSHAIPARAACFNSRMRLPALDLPARYTRLPGWTRPGRSTRL